MKKLVYSLALVVMGLASCTSWDDAITENYGDGPTISIGIQAVAPTDSAFTVTLTPASGTTYYAFVVDQNDETEELNNYTLLKGGYGNSVVNTSDYPTLSFTIDNAVPNTTYQVYAVASNDKGVAGQVAVASITTTDSYKPSPKSFKADAANKSVAVTFREAVSRGEGKVTAKYYKEWDILNPVDIAEDEITVSTSGTVVNIATPTAPAGAYVTISYEAGSFVDAAGNACNALTSGLNMTTGKFTNINFRVPTVEFAVTDDNITSPADGSLVADWNTFVGVFTFSQDIYRNDETVEDGDVSVTYTGSKKSAVYKLSAGEWSVDGDKLIFKLPEAAAAGDVITVSLVSGAVTDVLGNPNAAFTSKTSWKYFAATKDMVLGSFGFAYQSAYDETPETYDGGIITIVENADEENGLIIKDLYLDGSEIEGYYDLNKGKLFIYAYQALGIYTNSKGTKYGLITYSLSNNSEIEFTINPDGTVSSTDFGVVACDENYESALGWWEKATIATFTPKAAASRSKAIKSYNSKKVNVSVSRTLKKIVK